MNNRAYFQTIGAIKPISTPALAEDGYNGLISVILKSEQEKAYI